MFNINSGKGFSITFNNGVRVSVQFGIGNYCTEYFTRKLTIDNWDEASRKQARDGSGDAEIAIIGADDKWLTREFDIHIDDDVVGYCSPFYVLKALVWAEAYNG